MDYTKKLNFRMGEDAAFCAADRIFGTVSLKDQSEDFILPDYLPDVKKVISVFPLCSIKGRFMGSGTLEYEGEVSYRILYVADDHSIKSALFTTGFDEKLGGEDFSEECVELIRPLCKNLSARLLNPRKLNIRSTNGAEIEVYKRRCFLPVLYGARTLDDEQALETLVEEVKGSDVLSLRENGLTLSEDISFEAAMPTAEELIFSKAALTVQECRVLEGEAQIRGVAEIFCLLSAGKNGEGREEWILLSRPLSFSQTLKNEGLHEGGKCFARLLPEGMEFRLREDEFGQKRVVEMDVTYLCDLEVFYEKPLSLCLDAYSIEGETEKNTVEKHFFAPVSQLKGGFSVNESVTLDLPEEGGYSVVCTFAEPFLHVAEEGKNGKAVLEGECALSLLLKDSAGAPDVRRTTLPLRFVTDVALPEEGLEGQISAKASGIRCRLDKNQLSCDMELTFGGLLLGATSCSYVDTLRILPEKRQKTGRRGSVILYYPEKDESLFSIAKKYGVRRGSLSFEEGEGAPLMIYCK